MCVLRLLLTQPKEKEVPYSILISLSTLSDFLVSAVALADFVIDSNLGSKVTSKVHALSLIHI